MDIKDLLPEVKENVSLAQYTTIKIGGKARYFFIAENKEDLIKAIKTAQEINLPLFILGAGSNILFSDKGFNGLVIKIQDSRFKIQDSKIYVGAGLELDRLVDFSIEESFSGLEWAAGIPGTIGGATYGNAQAFYNKVSDIIESVELLDIKTLEIKNFSQKECCFSNKSSIFKSKKNLIILSAVLKLKKGNKEEIEKKIKEHLNYREQKHPLDLASAGSVFVNKEIKGELVHSGYLIEQSGLKGKRIGNAQISDKHANFIVNLGRAEAKDVLALIKLAKKKVKQKFGIDLEEEIQIIPSN